MRQSAARKVELWHGSGLKQERWQRWREELVAGKEVKGRRKVAREKPEHVGRCAKTGHVAVWCKKGGNKNLYAIDEDDSENVEDSADNEEDLQAWCLLEESDIEQWQEVISRRSKQRAKNVYQASLLSVESSHSLSPKKIVEVKDKWVKVRVTMDSGAAGHVLLETMFSNLSAKHHRRSQWQQMEQIKDLGVKSIPFKTKPIISMQKKVVRAGNIVVLDEMNPHIRNTRDGTVIKLDLKNGVYTMGMWILPR